MTSGAVATFSAPSGSTRYKGHGVLNCLPTPTILPLPLPLPSLSLSYATLLALLIICCCFLKCGHYWRRRGCRGCRGCQGCLGLGSGGEGGINYGRHVSLLWCGVECQVAARGVHLAATARPVSARLLRRSCRHPRRRSTSPEGRGGVWMLGRSIPQSRAENLGMILTATE